MKPSLALARAGPSRLALRPRALPAISAASAISPRAPARPRRVQLQAQPQRSFFSLPDITKLANLVPGAEIESSGEEQRFHARKILP
jgi:coenzyme Q-binding protein COQ10